MDKDEIQDASDWLDLLNQIEAGEKRIAKQQNDIEAYRAALGYSVSGDHNGRLSDDTFPVCGLCDAKQKRIAELEVALREIADHPHFTDDAWFPSLDWERHREGHRCAAEIARKALKEKEG